MYWQLDMQYEAAEDMSPLCVSQKNKYLELHVGLLSAGLNAWSLSNSTSSRPDRVPKPPTPAKDICSRFLPSLLQLLSEVQLSQLSAALRQHRLDLQLQYGTAFSQLERSIFSPSVEHQTTPETSQATKRKRKQPDERPTETGEGSSAAAERDVSGEEQRAIRVPDSYLTFVQRHPFGSFALLAHAMALSQQIAWCARSAADAAGALAPGQAANAAQMDRDEELRAHIQLLLALMARFEDAPQLDLSAQQTASYSASSPVLVLEDILLQSLVRL